jgi:hypothetical protein
MRVNGIDLIVELLRLGIEFHRKHPSVVEGVISVKTAKDPSSLIRPSAALTMAPLPLFLPPEK